MSWFDNPKHPMWTLILLVTVIGSVFLFCALGYKNPLSEADMKTIFAPGVAVGLIELFRIYFGGKADKKDQEPATSTSDVDT